MKPFIVLVETRCKTDSYFIGFDDQNEAIKEAQQISTIYKIGSRYDIMDVKVINIEKGEIPFK